MKVIKFFLLYLWQLPQNLIGLILYIKYRNKSNIEYCNDIIILKYNKGKNGAISLGKYIIIFSNYKDMNKIIKHEYGHTIQSKLLGPFYLLIIGLPSIIWNLGFKKYRKKHNKSYYDFYTEKWANKLGGVK